MPTKIEGYANGRRVPVFPLHAAAPRTLLALDAFRWHHPSTAIRLRLADRKARQLVCLSGRVEIERAMETVRLEAGMVWSPPRDEEARGGVTMLRPPAEKGPPPVIAELVFAAPLAAEYVDFLVHDFGRVVRFPNQGPAHRALRALARETTTGRPPESISRKIHDWLSALHAVLRERHVHLADLLRGRIEQLLPDCADHGYSIKALATHLGCSPSYLATRIRQSWQRPAGEVLQALRVHQAWRLLTTTTLGVGEVGSRCGFASVSSFATSFKRLSGVTPAAARALPAPPPPAPTPAPVEPVAATVADCERTLAVSAVWNGPYFQFDGGVADIAYAHPYDLAINTLSNAVHWVLTLEGEAVFECAGRSVRLTPGKVLVHPQPLRGRLLTPGARPWRRLWIKVRGEWAVEAMLALGAAHGWTAHVPLSSAPARRAMDRVGYWSSLRSEPSVDSSRAAHEWLCVWWRFLSSYRPPRDAPADGLPDLRALTSRSFFRQIKSIASYAAQVGYTREHMSRKLRAQWSGGTPAQILRRHRLAQAALDLKHTRMSVGEIARRAQFASSGTFIVAFKKRYGRTPLAFRLEEM